MMRGRSFFRRTTGFTEGICVLGIAVLVLFRGGVAKADPANGSFESNNFSGWTVMIPFGDPKDPPLGPRAAGSADVTQNARGRGAIDGDFFAVIGTGHANLAGNHNYDIFASQTLFMNQGESLSGWAAFYNGDYHPQDSAWVRILDSNNLAIATPWIEFSGGMGSRRPNHTDYRTTTPWEFWEWEAPSTGQYILELGVSTFGDDSFDSYGLFDDIEMTPPSAVPEPSTSMLLGLGVLGALAYRKKFRR